MSLIKISRDSLMTIKISRDSFLAKISRDFKIEKSLMKIKIFSFSRIYSKTFDEDFLSLTSRLIFSRICSDWNLVSTKDFFERGSKL